MLTINTDTARRFILGKQGLWICAIREVSRREQAGCNGDSPAAAAPTRLRI